MSPAERSSSDFDSLTRRKLGARTDAHYWVDRVRAPAAALGETLIFQNDQVTHAWHKVVEKKMHAAQMMLGKQRTFIEQLQQREAELQGQVVALQQQNRALLLNQNQMVQQQWLHPAFNEKDWVQCPSRDDRDENVLPANGGGE